MNKITPSSITIEEAVARMVNMDYIPAGLTLLEMTSAFREEAEVDYENAKIDRSPDDHIASLKIRLDSCTARHELAQLLMESLKHEVKSLGVSTIVLADDSSSQNRLTLESVSDWAADRFGIGIPEWSARNDRENTECDQDSNAVDSKQINVSWKDVTIKIWKDYKIGYSFKKGDYKRSSFREIDLMGMLKNEPNQRGIILIGLSQKKKFPFKIYAEGADKTAISKLRNALQRLTGLTDDPFHPFNPVDGWKPQFTLIYDVNNADERAKKKAIHVELEEYYREDDAKMRSDNNISGMNDSIDLRFLVDR